MNVSAASVAATDVVQFFRVLADETRLTILRLLALSDLRAGEIGAQLHAPQNAVSYHLKQFRSLGLLRDHRSSFDARDIYYSVDLERLHALYAAAGDALHPAMKSRNDTEECITSSEQPIRILFLCTHNSARSQLAEGITRHLAGDQVEVFSAGNQPTEVHPLTLVMLEEWGIDTSQHRSKSMNTFLDQQFDYIITVCDRVRDGCPTFPGDAQEIHWSLPDPTKIEDAEEQLRAFYAVRRELNTRIRYLLCLPHPPTGRRVQIRSMTAAQQRDAS
jgi:protein-tyrosine-phosphatase/DNA-binding transcriptional ArsR family regulator